MMETVILPELLLELSDVILEVAEDLCHGCNMSEYSSYRDIAWETKYIQMKPYKKML